MTRYRFDRFTLDTAERRLLRDGVPVELATRYLDALALLVAEAGRLVTKDRFLAEVWHGVPVTDEALTQCIRTLRRALGDDAARPRFIATVPRHGYRFIAAVTGDADRSITAAGPTPGHRVAALAGAGTLGAGLAGLVGGLAYGALAAAQPLAGASGVAVLLVVTWLTITAALTGGAGVGVGIALASLLSAPAWRIAGGAIGGMIVGGTVKLLGLDAFGLLLGRSPVGITGAAEGLALGGAVGAGAWLAIRSAERPLATRVARAASVGAIGAVAIVALGGVLMAGSLDLLAVAFPESRLRLGGAGVAFRLAAAAMEGALFAGAMTGAMLLADRRLAP